MNKGLEAIKNRLINDGWLNEDKTGVYEKEFAEIEKELKVLEIIRNKKVDFGLLDYIKNEPNPLQIYNRCYRKEWQLTQEEYDLLKETLL